MAKKKTEIPHDLIVHPGETIAEVLELHNITQAELAARAGVSAAYVCNVITGKKDISAKLAMGLEYALGVSKSFWLNLQAEYDAELLVLHEVETITEEEIKIYDEIREVVQYLQECEVVPKSKEKKEVILSLRKVLQVSSLINLKDVIIAGGFRLKPNADINPAVVGAWSKLCQMAEIPQENSVDRPKEKEHQSIEWKESWQDEYLKWICGYANAYGGVIYIGMDDNGNVVGIDNAKDLLEKIPNKITNTMGIIADVNLLHKGGLEYLQIVVEKYPSLISYHGKYYYRSGSTMREITGKELERTLLKVHGRTWDSVSVPRLAVSDLRQEAIQVFKEKAVKRGRLTKEEVSVETSILLDNLHLLDDEGYLIRAAMLAFYRDPEKWVTGSYIKIGYFGKSDADLVYQDEVHGPLLEQIDKTVDLVYTKYMKALIFYDGIQRVEQFMFHKDAFREILLNAVVHKDYSSCNPIQISVYEDKIYIWNDGEMPSELDSTEKLFMKHSSKPYNPKLANEFFKSGMIEAWGRGFDKIKEACEWYAGPLPEYTITKSGVMVLCKACDKYLELLRDDGRHLGQVEQNHDQDGHDVVMMILEFCKEAKSIQEIMDEFGFDSRTSFRRNYLTSMLKDGTLKMSIPDKPSSKKQRYFS